jgi:hypothetical protein
MLAKLNAYRARFNKAAAPAVGLVAQVVALGVLHGTTLHYAQVVLAAATLVGVVAAPKNADKPPA